MSIFDIWNQVKSRSTNYEPEVDVEDQEEGHEK
jgi:hypothetical protein